MTSPERTGSESAQRTISVSLVGAIARAPEDRHGRADPGPRESILIVEDEYFVALDMEASLLAAGFQVAGIARTAEEAVTLAETQRPHLVVMDVALIGERDGVDAAIEIFERFGIKSVFATAHRDPGTIARASRAHAAGWVTKPYSAASLLTEIEAALRRPRNSR